MMRKLLLAAVSLLGFSNAQTCTTFFMNLNGHLLFGRNYDWVTETGVVNTNLRGQKKTSLPMDEGKTISWTSSYGSISFNQYGKEFPTGGMNEKGLVVELMWLSESRFPAADERPSFSVLQWIQYQLDNCATIQEVMETDKKIRIDAGATPQHYLIADASGQAATIEFLEGKMEVHTGASLPYPVLANTTYQQSIEALQQSALHKDSLHFSDNSLQRFGSACRMLTQVKQGKTSGTPTEQAFHILNGVSQGNFTKWSIVYDITTRQIHFRTADHSDVKIIDFKDFDLSCGSKPLCLSMGQDLRGNVHDSFLPYTNESNRNWLKKAFQESRSQISVEESSQEAMAANAAAVKCN